MVFLTENPTFVGSVRHSELVSEPNPTKAAGMNSAGRMEYVAMKNLFLTLFLICAGLMVNAQTPKKTTASKPVIVQNKTVEIACGECKFKMKGKSCDLAIRMDGKSYFVDGKSIDDFGDAHDEKHGFCNAISQAEVTGEIVNNRFKAKTITLLPEKK